jgi:hypothetical protein
MCADLDVLAEMDVEEEDKGDPFGMEGVYFFP